MIEEIDHQLAFAAQSDIGALIDIANIDQDGVVVLPAPSANLSNTPREAAHVRISVVVYCRKNMTMQIGRMQNGDANRIRIQWRPGMRQTGNRTDQTCLTDEL